MNGTYHVVVYKPAAQSFILDNLEAIVESEGSRPENQGKPWSQEDDHCLREQYARGTPVNESAAALKRSGSAIRACLKKLGLNQ